MNALGPWDSVGSWISGTINCKGAIIKFALQVLPNNFPNVILFMTIIDQSLERIII